MASRPGVLRTATGTQSYRSARSPICRPCLRFFATTAIANAGHNKWSKTKHIKAVTDKKKMSERNAFTKLITMYSRLYGEDLKFNPQLANTMAAASKANVPKSVIEGAIARGQGRSATGAKLEPMLIEALVPPNIAIIAEAETDNKNRTWADIKHLMKDSGAANNSTAFYFTKRGRARFTPQKDQELSLSTLLEGAIELEGLDDVEEREDGSFLVWTEPSHLLAITEALSNKFGLEVLESDIVWASNEETRVELDSPDVIENLENLVSGLREYPEIKGVYANVRQGSIADDVWQRIERHIDL